MPKEGYFYQLLDIWLKRDGGKTKINILKITPDQRRERLRLRTKKPVHQKQNKKESPAHLGLAVRPIIQRIFTSHQAKKSPNNRHQKCEENTSLKAFQPDHATFDRTAFPSIRTWSVFRRSRRMFVSRNPQSLQLPRTKHRTFWNNSHLGTGKHREILQVTNQRSHLQLDLEKAKNLLYFTPVIIQTVQADLDKAKNLVIFTESLSLRRHRQSQSQRILLSKESSVSHVRSGLARLSLFIWEQFATLVCCSDPAVNDVRELWMPIGFSILKLT